MSLPNTKKDYAYNLLRQAIISGELKPGEIFKLAELSDQYGVGITPVREALIVLEAEGFIHSLPRTGFVVSPVSVQEILEIFHLRFVLEVEAIDLAVDRMPGYALVGLEENYRKEIAIREEFAGNDHRVLLFDLDRGFHTAIASASGNKRLARLVEQLLDDMARTLTAGPFLHDPEEHAIIIQALQNRDRAAAREAMRRHLDTTRGRIVDHF